MAVGDFARMEVRPDGRFRILQVADFHSDVEERLNERTRADVRAMAAHFAPDLLAVTGDIWCGDEHPEAAPMWRQRDLAFLGALGLPWAFALGNHDYVGDLDDAFALIAATPHAVAPCGSGRGDFRIEVTWPNAAQARGHVPRRRSRRLRVPEGPALDVFFLNSGPRWNLPGDLRWFEEEIERINESRGLVLPAIVFFHIPLENYQRAINEGRTIGVGDEDVLNWGDEEGIAAAILKRAGRRGETPGNVRACFCAHSHKNDFYFEEDGVIFAYGRATGYGGYGGEELAKGAKLIEVDIVAGTLSFMTVFADGTSWGHAMAPLR